MKAHSLNSSAQRLFSFQPSSPTSILSQPKAMIVTPKVKKAISAGTLLVLAAFAVLKVDEQLNTLRTSDKVSGRQLSTNLGGGDCNWEPPNPNLDPDIDFHKVLLA